MESTSSEQLERDYQEQIVAGQNPMKWPSFNIMGADLAYIIQKIKKGSDFHKKIIRDIIDAPCSATVKLDGTNVGIDNNGLLFGRNTAIPDGQNYQKTPIHALTKGYGEKIQRVFDVLQKSISSPLFKIMVYGELMFQQKHDYTDSSIFKKWFCFGVVLKAIDKNNHEKMAEELRAAGYSSIAKEEVVVISPNDHLFAMFKELDIPTVVDYRPVAIPADRWNTGYLVPTFPSLHAFLESDWCNQYFLNPETGALGEGMVVTTALNGDLYKLKHGGEDCGQTPERVWEAIEFLKTVPEMDKELAVFTAFERIMKARYKEVEKPKKADPQPKAAASAVDEEAQKAWASALTKEDDLDDLFARGEKNNLTKRLVNQIKEDLVKDYGVDEKAAMGRSSKFVNATIGKLYGEWTKKQAPK